MLKINTQHILARQPCLILDRFLQRFIRRYLKPIYCDEKKGAKCIGPLNGKNETIWCIIVFKVEAVLLKIKNKIKV